MQNINLSIYEVQNPLKFKHSFLHRVQSNLSNIKLFFLFSLPTINPSFQLSLYLLL